MSRSLADRDTNGKVIASQKTQWSGYRSIRFILAAAVLASVVIAIYLGWQRLRGRVLAEPEYLVTADRIEITPPPDWIRSDVKAEAIRDGSLDQSLSLLDPNLPARVHAAFSLHPWVAQVRVRLDYPARVHVTIDYRRPVAMVEVPGGLLPVDAHGIILPTADFSPLEATRYPRIARPLVGPQGATGDPWGDATVHRAAAIAALLVDHWERWKLYKIAPVDDSNLFDLLTRSEVRLRWGHAPGQEGPGEPNAESKLARLQALIQKQGALDESDAGQAFDLSKPEHGRLGNRLGLDRF